MHAAEAALARGARAVVIDRCNQDVEQRRTWIKVGSAARAPVHAVWLDLPVDECARRATERAGHEGGVDGAHAPAVVLRMAQALAADGGPLVQEGFVSVRRCRTAEEADAALAAARALVGAPAPPAKLPPPPVGAPAPAPACGPPGPPSSSDEDDARPPRVGVVGAAPSGAPAAAPRAPHWADALVRLVSLADAADAEAEARAGGGDDGPAAIAAREAGVVASKPDHVVVVDRFPKSRRHVLAVARAPRLRSVADLSASDAPLVRAMLRSGLAALARLPCPVDGPRAGLPPDPPAGPGILAGFHSRPSLARLHLHVMTGDLCSPSLKTKAHYNSFASGFMIDASASDADDASSLLARLGALPAGATLGSDPAGAAWLAGRREQAAGDLRPCRFCGYAGRNLPGLKRHLERHWPPAGEAEGETDLGGWG